jgi:hypothetical protein
VLWPARVSLKDVDCEGALGVLRAFVQSLLVGMEGGATFFFLSLGWLAMISAFLSKNRGF